jgi:hypothetical protein
MIEGRTRSAAAAALALAFAGLTPDLLLAAPAEPNNATASNAAALRGIWESEAWSDINESGRPAGGIATVKAKSALSAHPPYNAEWEARFQAASKDVAALSALGATMKVCSFAFPGAMESPSLFQIVVTPEETLFLFATPEIRQVYTDGRKHPASEDLWPTPMGDSVGYWEGDTLVIDTIARRATAPIRFSSPMTVLSEQARFIERIRRVSVHQLENEMTVEDPVALARPWVMKLRYRRVTDLDRLPPHDCSENDRNPVVDGKMTIAPP